VHPHDTYDDTYDDAADAYDTVINNSVAAALLVPVTMATAPAMMGAARGQ
jgi:hypothetical protein